jgi:hypothetical protein
VRGQSTDEYRLLRHHLLVYRCTTRSVHDEKDEQHDRTMLAARAQPGHGRSAKKTLMILSSLASAGPTDPAYGAQIAVRKGHGGIDFFLKIGHARS